MWEGLEGGKEEGHNATSLKYYSENLFIDSSAYPQGILYPTIEIDV